MDFETGGGTRRTLLADAGSRRVELIEIGDISADQDVTAFDLVGEKTGGGRIGEQLDRKLREDRPVLEPRFAVEQAAGIIGKGLRLRNQRVGQERRQSCRTTRPAAHHAIRIRLDPHARRRDVARRQAGLEGPHEPFLPGLDEGAVGGVRRKAELHRGLHVAEGVDQDRIVGLRLIDQHVDRDALRAHPVEIGQRRRQDAAVERRDVAGQLQCAIGVDDHHDPVVLGHARRGDQHTHVVECAFGIDPERQRPGITREQDRRQQQDRRPGEPSHAHAPHRPRDRARTVPGWRSREGGARHQGFGSSGRLPSPTSAKADQ